MYCRNCGTPLFKTDKFCNQCGASVKVPTPPEENLFRDGGKSEEIGLDKEMDKNFEERFGWKASDFSEDPLFKSNNEEREEFDISKIKPPTEEFNWDTNPFPNNNQEKTEDVDFNWNVSEHEFRKRPQEEEIAFAPDKQKEEKPVGPKIWKQEDGKSTEEIDNRQVSKTPPVGFNFVEPKPYEPKEDMAIMFKKELPEEKTEVPDITEPVIVSTDKPIGPKMWAAVKESEDNHEKENVVKGIKEDIIQGEELEKQIFDGLEQNDNIESDELISQTQKINKFYTFNEKNEEFQKLLDKEYEKVIGQRAEDSIPSRPKVDPIDSVVNNTDGEEVLNEPVNQIKEMADARESFFAEPKEKIEEELPTSNVEEDKILDSSNDEKNNTEKEEISKKEAKELEKEEKQKQKEEKQRQKEEKQKQKEEKQRQKEEKQNQREEKQRQKEEKRNKKSEKQAKKEEQKDESKDQEFKDNKAELVADEVVTKGKAGDRALNAIITVLVIILIALIVAVASVALAPDSVLAQKVNNVTQKVVQVLQGEKLAPIAVANDKSQPIDDKTGLIQIAINRNFNNNIETIRYNSSLEFGDKGNYNEKDIANSIPLTTNIWYEKPDGKKVYLQENLIGALIEYKSKELAKEDGEKSFTTLDIGEIRKGEKGYYIWTAQYGTNNRGEEVTTKKVYLIKVNDKNMNVNKNYTIKM